MAISWPSSYSSVGGPVSFRAGIDITYSPSTVTAATESVTVTTRLYLQANGPANAAGGSWSVSGSDTGSGSQVSWSISGAGGTALIATLTETVALAYGATKTFSINATIRPSGSWPGSVSHSRTYTLPARPVATPNAPTGLTVTRVSDIRQDLAWTNNSTSDKPYTSVEVWRRLQGSGWSDWTRFANLTGSTSSVVDGTTRDSRAYEYRVRALNGGGASGWSGTAYIATTPPAPAAPTVGKSASGNIVVTRPSLWSTATGWRVWHLFGGGAGTTDTLVSGATPIPAGTSSWTHPSPDPADRHRYRIEAVTSSPTLYSPKSAYSVAIEIIAPPNAPTNLGPAVTDGDVEWTVMWQHNPVDTTPQSKYEVRRRLAGSTTWEHHPATSSSPSHSFPTSGFYPNGSQVEWSVRTWGEHADPSPWSATQVTTLSTPPVAGIVTSGASHDSSRLDVAWTYHDAESSAQSRWEVALTVPSGFGGGGTGSSPAASGTVVESRSGFGQATTHMFAERLDNGATYVAWVRVADGAGMWSQWASQEFTVTYAQPPKPTLAAQWHKDDGYTTLSVDAPSSGTGEAVLDSITVQRATDEGWVVVASNLDPGATVTDMIPPLGQAVTYRAVALSDLPSERHSDAAVVETEACWLFINHGPGFGQVARVRSNVTVARGGGRSKTRYHFAGREDPVEFAGQSRSRHYQVQASLWAPWVVGGNDNQSTYDDLLAASDALAPVCVRDPNGTRLFVSTDALDESGLFNAESKVSLPMVKVDWAEPVL